jgi:cobalt-zinc-cadmium efflux system membrane fusion protein
MRSQRLSNLRLTTLFAAMVIALLATDCSRETPENASADSSTSGDSLPRAVQMRGVRTDQVALVPFRRTVEATGTVAFDQNRSTQILSPISGPVARLLVNVGSRVSQGQALAVVASPDFASAVSTLRKAEATARNARRIADLDRELFKNDAISRRDLEQGETDAVSAEADRDAALQQLKALGVETGTLNDIRQNRPVANAGAIIRSPLSGTVVERLISPGQLLQAGTTPCFTVADLSAVWVLANVFEADLPFVAVGDPAEVMTESGGQPLAGQVQYVAALVDPGTRAVSVRLAVPNPREVLKRDMYVKVAIHSRRQGNALLAPVSAILRDDQNLPFVFVARPDHSFTRRNIQLGGRIGDRQEITSGLQPGETIVVEGGLFLGTVEHQ